VPSYVVWKNTLAGGAPPYFGWGFAEAKPIRPRRHSSGIPHFSGDSGTGGFRGRPF